MPTTKKLDALKINKLTEAQLATATVSEDELYLVTDAENPVTVKTDSTLNGNGSAEKPLSVSRYISAEVISAKKDGGNPNHLFFETLDNTTTWHMYQYNFESSYVGVGNTKGQIGRVGATLDAVYAAKLCKDSTELSVRDGTSGDIAVTSELPEAKTGTAGQVYTKTETGAEWKDATGGGSSLPDQTDNAGKFLTTDGTNASWSDKPLVNTSADAFGLGIGNLSSVQEVGAPRGGLAIGYGANTYRGAMLLNSSGSLKDNYEVGTFKVCITDEVYTLIDANGLIPSARLAPDGTTGQVLAKTDTGMEWKTVSGGGSSADNNGLEGDYCSKYGIVDETASGLPTQGTGNQIIIPAQLVMNVPGVSGLTTNASEITHDLVSTTNCEIFLSEGTVIEATDVFFQTDEPETGVTGYAAWWNGTEWKFKSNDTGNVWRAENAVRIAKCIFTDGALTRLCFAGCRVLDKQEWLPKNGITTEADSFSYIIKTKRGEFTCKCDAFFGSYWAWGIGANFLQYGFGSVGTIGGKQTTGARLFKTGGLYDFYIGTQWDPLDGLYTKTINGGADNAVITVPTVSGTMVVATPPTTAGNYVLKATVAEDGTVTTQWVAEA